MSSNLYRMAARGGRAFHAPFFRKRFRAHDTAPAIAAAPEPDNTPGLIAQPSPRSAMTRFHTFAHLPGCMGVVIRVRTERPGDADFATFHGNVQKYHARLFSYPTSDWA
ncbi:hypothetical protein DF044_18920 [Burkholderia contaminans]|nr:hypothetical protein DF044_18920 [Burkholderia contaminans]